MYNLKYLLNSQSLISYIFMCVHVEPLQVALQVVGNQMQVLWKSKKC